MKKLFFSLLLTANVMFVSCAEKKQQIPMYVITTAHTQTNPYLYTTHNQHGVQTPEYCTANQPGWEFFDNIMNMTYNDSHAPTSEIQLTPIYKPATTKIAQQEKPNPALMQALYNDANQLAEYQLSTDTPDWMVNNKNITLLIYNMNNAKKHGITEDSMGKFAYKSYNHNTTSKYIPLLFALLKRYNLTIKDTKETPPFEIDAFCDEKLKNIFNIKSSENSENKYPTSNDELEQYPAYVELTKKLKKLLIKNWSEALDHLSTCLYDNEEILFLWNSDGSSTDLLNDFYTKTYNLLFKNGVYGDLYDILLLINKAKKLGVLTQEVNLGHAILNFDKTKLSFLPTLTHWHNKTDFTIETKNRLALFCKLIQDYNNTDPEKHKPTLRQYCCHAQAKDFNFALPDSFISSLFDENHYAFSALEKLLEDAANLARSDTCSLQICVNQIYYPTRIAQ